MPRSLNFQQIEAFKAVMQLGTTTGAALMLNTTQPSISRRIAELQHQTGLRLFDLHHGRLRPTGERRMLYKTIQDHYNGLQKIESVVAVMRKSGTQTLRLGCTPTLAVGLLPAIVSRFLQDYPETHINIQTMHTSQLSDQLHQGMIDLALTTGELNANDHRPVLIKTTEAVCVLPLCHRLSDAEVIEYPMLRGEPILSIGENDELSLRVKAQLQQHGLPDVFAVQTPSSITVCALVAAGSGIGIVTPYVTGTFSGQLLVKPLRPALAISVSMAMPSHAAPSLLTRRVVYLLLAETKTPINGH